ncbi:MAG TPA: hypothetical protein VJ124_02370 [Pyrinomonadaceae bacterium]|nr:hypothetical protein [Pyrinomonadaceae bacterium]
MTVHEFVDTGCTVQHCLHIRGCRLVIIEVLMQSSGLLIKLLDESVYVIFSPGIVELALVKRCVEALTKSIRLIFDSLDNLLYLFVI